jgi:hypothetical protein
VLLESGSSTCRAYPGPGFLRARFAGITTYELPDSVRTCARPLRRARSDLRVVAATEAWLSAALVTREQIVGRQLLEAKPDNPRRRR